jgi:hypothetical protein
LGKALGLSPETIEQLRRGSDALKAAQEEAKQLGLSLTEADEHGLKEMIRSWREFTALVSAATQKIGAAVAPAFAQLLASAKQVLSDIVTYFQTLPLDQAIQKTFARLGDAFEKLGPALNPILTKIGSVLGQVIVEGIIQAFKQVISTIPSLFGTIIPVIISPFSLVRSLLKSIFQGVWTAILQETQNAWGAIVRTVSDAVGAMANGVSDGLIRPLQRVWDSIVEKAGSAWDAVAQSAINAFNVIKETFTTIGTFFTGIWNAIVKAATAAWNAITQAAIDAFNSLTDPITQVINNIINTIQLAIDKAKVLWSYITGNQQAAASGTGGDGSGLPAASGGLISGPGTATSDSIPAWLSTGEFVMRASAVRNYGVGLMHALNSLQAPRFAAGGLNLGHAAPRFATASVPVSGQRVLHLSIEGRSFSGLSIPENTAKSLERFAVNSQIASTGRKPSWRR